MHIYPHELSELHSPDELPGQAVISRSEEALPANFVNNRLRDFILSCHPSVTCSKIWGPDREVIGFCVGDYISEDGELYGELTLSFSLTHATVEQFIDGLSGRFFILIVIEGVVKIYLDPCASSPLVYDASAGIAATSPCLIPYLAHNSDNKNLIDAIGIPFTNGMYPIGLTPRHGISRLLPGHRLDLEGWIAERYWPRTPFETVDDVNAAVLEIAQIVKKIISAVARQYPVQMSLTAGIDSRLLLACSTECLDNVSFFTWAIPDNKGEIDCHIAKRLAKAFHLNHEIIKTEHASDLQKEAWLYRTGCSVGELRGLDSIPMAYKLDRTKAYLPGLVCEVARAKYWKSGSKYKWSDISGSNLEGYDISAENLLKFCNAPVTDETIEAVTSWRNSLPDLSNIQVMDIFYVEQRLACWAGAYTPGYAETYAVTLWPFNNKRILELVIALPEEYKLGERLNYDVIKACWPELLDYPVNRGDFSYKIKKALSNPSLACAKLFDKIANILR